MRNVIEDDDDDDEERVFTEGDEQLLFGCV